jgi:hypothetical protein
MVWTGLLMASAHRLPDTKSARERAQPAGVVILVVAGIVDVFQIQSQLDFCRILMEAK